MIKVIGRVLLSLSIIAGVSLPVAPGVISVANAADEVAAPAPADTTAPTVTNGALAYTGYAPIIPTSGAAGASISVRFVAADNIGIATTSVRLINPGNVVVTSASGTFVAGGVTDGAYSATLATASSGPRSGDVYQIQAQAIDAAGNSSGWLNLGSYTISGPSPGLTPTFGARVPDYYAPGFKHQITNYDPAYTWTVATTVGTASISSSGLVSVGGVGDKVSATVTVTTNRTGYSSGSASVTSVGPWNLSNEIQAQNITATLSGTTLTVNVPDNKGWRWGVIWSGAVQRTDIRTFPYTITNFTPNREIQLYADDSLMNYGYSRVFLPTVIPSTPVNLPGLTPTFGARTPDYWAPGFKHQITNYDPSYTWTVSSTVGTATISSSGLVSVAGVGAKVSATVTVTTNRSGYNSANASVTSVGPWSLSDEIQAQNITVTLSGTTLTVNVPDNRGWNWSLIWSGGVQRTNISTFPYTVTNFTPNREIQLGATDSLQNYGYSRMITPAAAALLAQMPLSTTVSTPLRVGSTANLSTSGGSGTGSITYTSLTTSTCTVSGTVVTARVAGRCGILAIKAGDSTYSEANVGTNFTVTSATLLNQATVTISPYPTDNMPINSVSNFLVSGGSGTGAISVRSQSPSVCSVTSTQVRALSPGTCVIAFSKAGDATYLSFDATYSFNVGKIAQAPLSFSMPSSVRAGSSIQLTATGGTGTGALVFVTPSSSTVCRVSGSTLTAVGIGTCTVNVVKTSDTNYLAVDASASTTITTASLLTQAPVFFISLPSNLSVNSTGTFQVGGGSGVGAFSYSTSTPSICSVSGTQVRGLATGTCTLVATKAADSSFLVATASMNLAIQGLQNQSPLVITIPGLPTGSINVGGFYGVTITGGSGTGSVTYSTSTPSVCALSGTANPTMFPFQIQGVAPGTCTVTVRKAADSNNLEASVTRSYSVASLLKNQLPIVIEAIAPMNVGESVEIKASGGSGTGAFTYPSVSSNACMTSGSTIYTKGPGTCTITVRKEADSEYLTNTATYSFTVRAGKPTVRFSPSMTSGQVAVGSFYVSANGSVGAGFSGRIAQVCLTMDGSPVTSGEVSNSNGYYWSNGYSGSSNCFNVSNSYYSNNSYRWLLESKNFEPGMRTFNVTVVDSEGNRSDSASISLVLKSTKPTIQVLSPSMGSVAKGKINVSFSVTTAQEAGRYIRYIGISEENAVPTFSGAYGTWSSPFSSGIKAFSVGSSSSSGTYSFQVNTQKLQKGLRTIKVSVQDSYGDVVEATVGVDVQALRPTVQILTPTPGQTFEGVVSIKVQASPDPSATGGEISYIGIDNSQLTPEFAGVEQNSAAAGFPSNYRTWQVNDVRTFGFTATPGSLKNGLIRLTVLIADDTKASATASIDFNVSTANPTAVIISPVAGTIMPGVITLTAETKPNPVSGGRIVAIAISEKNAQPSFYGTPIFNSNNPNISRNYALWSVDDVQKPSWKIDTTGWDPGDRIITVVTQDSNGKVGQGTVVLNIPPKGTFTSTLAGPPVLGRSVPISVEMKTNAPYRSAPAVVVTLQSSPTEAGPWKDLGDITLDATGKGSGSVVVTAKLWVRALHKQLDAVQPGVGAPLRIVNVPDPNRTKTTSGDENPDGSTPKVTCVPKANTKVGKSVSISCSQIDVQDPSQPMTLFVQQKNKFVKANSAMFKDGFIRSSYASKSKGRLTFQIRGQSSEEDDYVAWKSNMFTITWS